MAVSLKKGQKVSLTKEHAGLNKILVGLGWDPVEKKRGFFSSLTASDIDCDASAILLKNDHFEKGTDLVYYGRLKHQSNAIIHKGDNLTGAGEGDDEQITVELQKVPSEYNKIIFAVNIYESAKRRQDFGMVKNCFIRLVDEQTNQELYRYNLSEEYSGMTAVIFGEIYRYNNEWKFNPVGQGTNDATVKQLISRYQ